jgi:hypothetical protein
MKLFTTIAAVVVATGSVLGVANGASAMSFRITSGVAGPNGVTNQGAYSEFHKLSATRTIDFNDGKAPTIGFAKYSFQSKNGSSSVRADQWAPVGANGERNTSKYLAVFQGNPVTIALEKTLNYFGIDWGAVSGGNTFSFFQNDKLVQSFTTKDIINNAALIRAKWQNNEGNGYVHFYSDSNKDNFNRIVISQVGGGGFESDNHSFHVGTGKFDFEKNQKVPEPGMALGMVAFGAMVAGGKLRRRPQP